MTATIQSWASLHLLAAVLWLMWNEYRELRKRAGR